MNLTKNQKISYIVLIALIAIIFYVRADNLGADPPVGLSKSTDVYTDPAQYTQYAKQKIQFDEFNKFEDYRFTFFINSTVTVLSYLFFKLFGLSITTSNAVGLFYSMGALLLMFMIVRKSEGMTAGLFYLGLIAFNYNQLFYGRLPFLEHAMIFWAFLSLVILMYYRSVIGMVIAGISLGLGIFFGKIIGIVFIAPFAVYLLYRIYYEKDIKWPKAFSFVGGFLSVVVFWLFYSYFPMKNQVGSYVGEQAFSLYGAPDGLKSLDNFIWKLVTLGYDSRLIERMIIPTTLGVIFIGLITYKLFYKSSWKNGLKQFNSGHLFILIAAASFYISLMIWNYRPLRYQLVLIYFMCGGAAFILSRLYHGWKSEQHDKIAYPFYLIGYFLVFIVFYQLYGLLLRILGTSVYNYDDYKYITAGWSLVLTVIIFAVLKMYNLKEIKYNKTVGRVAALILVGYVFITGGMAYADWHSRPTFAAADVSRELGEILGPDAVLAGPYAPQLTLNNNLGSIIHMFGVSQADPDLFKKYPITHLLIDGLHKKIAIADYTRVMTVAREIATYRIGDQRVILFRVSGRTDNKQSDSYQLSPVEEYFENLLTKHKFSIPESIEIVRKNPENMTIYTYIGEQAEADKNYTVGEVMFKKAVEFSPTNYHLIARLAKFYEICYNDTKELRYKEQALDYYAQALKYSPTNEKLKASAKRLKRK